MFAIVDIETTGGHASANGITEIAIVLHNGVEEEGRFSSLVNPKMPIQKFVQSLTGITDKMVATAPLFSEVAPKVFNLLKDRVFVAHNVNFDYSFVKHQLGNEGYHLDVPKLCTIRLSRKIFPGLPKYGLGALCHHFNIKNESRHRAMGDAKATARLFSLIVQFDKSGELKKMIKRRTIDQYLPPNLDATKIKNLPYDSGVYYFHDKKGKIIYVGKAKNLKKRVSSHFSNNKPSRQKQEFLRNIFDVSFKTCGSELMAAVYESVEIKRLWPIYNKSQKFYERSFGIYQFEDARGYLRLAIDGKKKHLQPLISFHAMADAHRLLWKLSKDFDLHPVLLFLDTSNAADTVFPAVKKHNRSLQKAVELLKSEQKTYLIKENKNNYFLIENGRFYGMASLQEELSSTDIDAVKALMEQYPENEVLKSMLRNYAEKNPQSVIHLS
jgi:DNA polymerase-3 subunit epsilon